MATDHAAIARRAILDHGGTWGMNAADNPFNALDAMENQIKALVAERDEAYRARAAAEKERDSLRVQWWDAMCEKDEQRKMRRAAEAALAEARQERDKAMEAIQSWRENYQRNDQEKYEALDLAHRMIAERDALAAALREIAAADAQYFGKGRHTGWTSCNIARAALAAVSPSTQGSET